MTFDDLSTTSELPPTSSTAKFDSPQPGWPYEPWPLLPLHLLSATSTISPIFPHLYRHFQAKRWPDFFDNHHHHLPHYVPLIAIGKSPFLTTVAIFWQWAPLAPIEPIYAHLRPLPSLRLRAHARSCYPPALYYPKNLSFKIWTNWARTLQKFIILKAWLQKFWNLEGCN